MNEHKSSIKNVKPIISQNINANPFCLSKASTFCLFYEIEIGANIIITSFGFKTIFTWLYFTLIAFCRFLFASQGIFMCFDIYT